MAQCGVRCSCQAGGLSTKHALAHFDPACPHSDLGRTTSARPRWPPRIPPTWAERLRAVVVRHEQATRNGQGRRTR